MGLIDPQLLQSVLLGGTVNQSYDTHLDPRQEQAFQAWAQQYGRTQDTEDYDLRGWWAKNGGIDPNKGHMTDLYKKPNHPTFSTGSMYHGVGDNQGGTWAELPGGKWQFTAGQTNMKHWSPEDLQRYFSEVEPGNSLVLPK